MKTLEILFGMKERVTRGTYLGWGLALMGLKYLGEVALYHRATARFLEPLSFLSPVLVSRYPEYPNLPDWFIPAVVLWTLPFVWIGVGMSIRRAADAGLSPWLGVLFFVPVLNFFLMFGLSVAPSSRSDGWSHERVRKQARAAMSPLFLSIAFALCGTLLTWFSTDVLRLYAVSLFVGSPLILGMVQGYLLRWKARRSFGAALGHVAMTILAIHLLLLLFALEGVICLAMSLPLSMGLGVIGAVFGAGIATYGRPGRVSPSLMLLVLPVMPWAESAIPVEPHRDMVLSVLEIDAPPARVWPNVVRFSELPPADDWLFRLGVAHPVRARIDGRGVGAIRHCEFSTGAFVEPITAWEEPTRLAFDVRYQPQPMRELSIYDRVDAPHLDGYFRSVRGEFRLVPLESGRTRLEGRTWYEVEMQPGWYWQFYGRWFIHKIHHRVLDHIKSLSEPSTE